MRPETTEQPAKPVRIWRPMVLWSAAILLALGLVWFAAAVVVPVWTLRSMLPGSFSPEQVVERLGGPDRALWRLQLYASLSERIAPAGEKAVYALGWCGPEAMPALVKGLMSPRPEIRGLAAQAIANGPLGPQAKAAVPALCLVLKDPHENLRSYSAQALGAIGPEAKESVPSLREALTEDSQAVRRHALLALGAIGPDARDALADVLSFLAGRDEVRKADAVLGVAGISRDGKMVMDAYSKIAGTGGRIPDSLYLYEMSEEMRGIGSGTEALAPLMEKLLADKDEDVRAYASKILRRIPGHESAPIIPLRGGGPKY